MNDPKTPNLQSGLVDIRALETSGTPQLVNSYGDYGFRILGERYSGSVILSPHKTLAWQPPENTGDLSIEDIMPYLGQPKPSLFILGVGVTPMAPMNDLAASLKGAGITMELMTTAAACRTWNVLMSEGRDAAAGLYAIA